MKTVSVALLNSIFYPAAKLGLSKKILLDAVGLDQQIFDDVENRVPSRYCGTLLKAAVELSGDKNIPLFIGQHVQPIHFNIFGYLLLNAPTVKDIYVRCLDYQGIVGDGLHISFEERSQTGHALVKIADPDMLELRNYTMAFHFAVHVNMHRQLVGKLINPEALYFDHPAPENLEPYKSFFGCELNFNAGRYELVFKREQLDDSIAHANPQLYTMFQKLADDILLKIVDKQHISWKVSRHLLDLLHSNEATIETVAGKMALGIRTLQRKLRDEGLSFNELLTNVRKELAIQHLSHQQLSITEISYLLGFSEPSVFHRSFKKWTGQTPKDFRHTNNSPPY